MFEINNRLLSDIERYCQVNRKDLNEYVNMILNSGFAADRFGNQPSFLQVRKVEKTVNEYTYNPARKVQNIYNINSSWLIPEKQPKEVDQEAEKKVVEEQTKPVQRPARRKIIKRTLESL